MFSATLFLSCTVLFLPSTAGVNAEVHTLDGRVLQGTPAAFDPSLGLTLEGREGSRVVPPTSLYALFFEEAGPISLSGTSFEAGVELADGSFLGGALEGGAAERIFFLHPLLGRIELDADVLSRLVLAPPSLPADFDAHPVLEKDDLLFKRRPDARGGDFVRGVLEGFSGQGLTFACDLGTLTFPFQEVEALTFAPMGPRPGLSGVNAEVVLRRGSGLLRGTLQRIDAKGFHLSLVTGKTLAVPCSAVASVLFLGTGRILLSDQPPEEREERTFIGGKGRVLYPARKDRSVTGALLSSGGRYFPRGMGVHAWTRLTWRLDEGASAFRAFFGLCDEVLDLPARGSVTFHVAVDGKEVFHTPVMHGGDLPVAVPPLPLEGASRITVTVDFGGDFDSGDRALIGDPVVVRVPSPAK